jgi:hypothetical protein
MYTDTKEKLMNTLTQARMEQVNGGTGALEGAGQAVGYAIGYAAHWIASGAEKVMTAYGKAVENGNGLPGQSSGGVAA